MAHRLGRYWGIADMNGRGASAKSIEIDAVDGAHSAASKRSRLEGVVNNAIWSRPCAARC
jgi:hypothetical protein